MEETLNKTPQNLLHKTALWEVHKANQAFLVDFAGWHMPLHYGSQIKEHEAVRKDAGVFDVSHMRPIDITGSAAKYFLSFVLANNIDKMKEPGRALYGCMLNENGGIIDDLITYWLDENTYRLVVNAATTHKDLAWLEQHQVQQVKVDCRDDLSILAVQGPNAVKYLETVLSQDLTSLKKFHCMQVNDMFIARTGYTGEDGCEIILPHEMAISVFEKLLEAGVMPCGLAARDTLRLEAGLNLYGTDMNDNTSPVEVGLKWTVDFSDNRDFIGRSVVEKVLNSSDGLKMVGLKLLDKGVLRPHQPVYYQDKLIGEISSGTFSPTLGYAIALAKIDRTTPSEVELTVKIRNHPKTVKQSKLPFYRSN